MGSIAKRIAKALDDGRFTRTSATDQHIQIPVEVKSRPVEEAPFPRHGDELGVRFGWWIAVQAYSGIWIEKRLAQTFH
jgi:hypothetical protein